MKPPNTIQLIWSKLYIEKEEIMKLRYLIKLIKIFPDTLKTSTDMDFHTDRIGHHVTSVKHNMFKTVK